MALPAERLVFRLRPPVSGWTFPSVLTEAASSVGPDFRAAFDVPLGVPVSALRFSEVESFLEWLDTRIFETQPVRSAADWSPARPFVIPERGVWKAVEEEARRVGYDLKRKLDASVGSESMFKLIGPKQVGAAARSLWGELREARRLGMEFRVWPFETGTLDDRGAIVAEIYPAAAYRTVIDRRLESKSRLETRVAWLDDVVASRWFIELGVTFQDRAFADASPDEFDAAVTALAVLRRTLEGGTLASSADPVAEGGMLCV